jgi:hypothetical protein
MTHVHGSEAPKKKPQATLPFDFLNPIHLWVSPPVSAASSNLFTIIDLLAKPPLASRPILRTLSCYWDRKMPSGTHS